MKAAHPPPSQLPPRTLLAVAALVPVVATLALAAFSVPLGKPGTLVYPYSGFDAIRLAKVALALPPIALLALAVRVAAREQASIARFPIFLLSLGIVGMGVWALTASPKWQRQNFFNMSSPSHDGAFLLEVEHVRQVGVPEYLRTFASRAATPPAEMKGTRVVSNPPAMTLIATACEAAARQYVTLHDALADVAVDEAGVDGETRRRAACTLLFSLVLIGMWALGGLALYTAVRTLAAPHVAAFVAACATVTPMTLLFTPGKDPAQLLTVALPLWLWLLALKRRNIWVGAMAGAAACLACCFGLVHVAVGVCVYVASLAPKSRPYESRIVFPLAGSALVGATLAAVALWWLTGYEIVAASRAVEAAQASVTRGEKAMPLVWQALGVPLFLLFCGPALWFLVLGRRRGNAPSPHAVLGQALVLTSGVVMLLTVGFTNIETPRLWIPFAALLTLGLTIASRWIDADCRIVSRLLAWIVVIQGLVSAYQWSKMDMRETEMRLLESPDGGARLFH